jgi:hypothetical protein
VHNPAAYDEATHSFTDGSLGGWAGPDTARAMARWAEFLAREYGDEVGWWITLDEPLVVLIAGYMSGDFPPGLTALSLQVDTLPFGQTPIDIVTKKVDADKAADFIRVDPPVHFVVESSPYAWRETEYALTGAFEPARSYTVTFRKGLAAANGSALTEDTERTVYLPDRPAALAQTTIVER